MPMPRIEGQKLLSRMFAVLSLCLFTLVPSRILAHPMGNFTINHYSGIRVERGWIEIRYFIDMAEIPTFQELQRSGLSGRLDDPKLHEYLSFQGQIFSRNLQIKLN